MNFAEYSLFSKSGFPNWCLSMGVLKPGCALGVCPDAIRSHVRLTHVLQSFEAFEGLESGHKKAGFLLKTACRVRPQSQHVCFHHCAQFFVLFAAHCVFTKYTIVHSRCRWPEFMILVFVSSKLSTFHGNEKPRILEACRLFSAVCATVVPAVWNCVR